MELFEKIYNKYYSSVQSLLNNINIQGNTYTKRQAQEYINTQAFGDYPGLKNHIGKDLELFKEEENCTPLIDSPIPILPTNLELEYLKWMMTDKKISPHIHDELAKKIQTKVKREKKEISLEKIWLQRNIDSQKKDQKEEKKLYETMQTIIQAIHDKKAIHYDSITKDKVKYKDCYAFPYKIDYSNRRRTYYLLALIYTQENKDYRMIRIYIKNIENIQVQDLQEKTKESRKKVGRKAILYNEYAELLEKVQTFYEEKLQEEYRLKLEIEEKYNALERAVQILSYYDKKGEYNKETKKYIFYVSYHDYQKSELIKDILSLGSAAEIIEPQEMRQEIIQRLQRVKKET